MSLDLSWVRRDAASGNQRGEKLGARFGCGSEDIDSPVQKSTEYQKADERVALEESLGGFVRSAPRASIRSRTHHVSADAASLQAGHASSLLHAELRSKDRKICLHRQSRWRISFRQLTEPFDPVMCLFNSVIGDFSGEKNVPFPRKFVFT